jgi:hypothetical protein
MFNAIEKILNLRELLFSSRQFTQETLTYKMLDWVLASVDWEHKYSLVNGESEHTSLFN